MSLPDLLRLHLTPLEARLYFDFWWTLAGLCAIGAVCSRD